MAALQTLRNKPALLMSVIGGALLLFIVTLTDLNSCSRPNIEGEVNGKELTYENYEAQIADEVNLETLILDNLNDGAKDNIRRQAWEAFAQNEVLAGEADRLGLVVTKKEVQEALANVSPEQLQQTMQMMQYGQSDLTRVPYAQKIMLLMAKYMGQPSLAAYQQFMKTADQQIAQLSKQNPEAAEMFANVKKACLYCEGRMPAELLSQKLTAMVQAGVIANPISAKMDFDESNTNYDVALGTIPYSTVADKDIAFTDADLKAKYEEIKEMFRLTQPTRDLKVIDVAVTASPSDRDALFAQVRKIEDTLRHASTAEAVEAIMKGTKTEIDYQNVYLSKSLLKQGALAAEVDSLDRLAVGAVTTTRIESAGRDGVQYVSCLKLVGKTTTPDSMQVARLVVEKKEAAEAIVKEAKAGTALAEIAKKYKAEVDKFGAKGDTAWVATQYYVAAKTGADSTASRYTDICQFSAGQVDYYAVPNPQTGAKAYIITKVLQTKAPSVKYNVAAVKYPVNFTQETYNGKKRALSEFLAKNNTLELLEKNASKAGYVLYDLPNFSTSEAMNVRMNIGGEQCRDAFVWAYGDAEKGQVSKIYECGTNNDHLLVVALVGENDGKYLAWDNATVKQQLETLVKQDKKAEKLMAEIKNAKKLSDIKVKGLEVNQRVASTGIALAATDAALAGAVERTKKGQSTGAVKGSNAVYFAEVQNVTPGAQTYNAPMQLMRATYRQLSAIFNGQSSLFAAISAKADVKDNRYKF